MSTSARKSKVVKGARGLAGPAQSSSSERKGGGHLTNSVGTEVKTKAKPMGRGNFEVTQGMMWEKGGVRGGKE